MAVISILKETRTKKGLTQEQLARKAEVSTSYIQKFEQNSLTRYSAEYLDKICIALECEISDLLQFVKTNE